MCPACETDTGAKSDVYSYRVFLKRQNKLKDRDARALASGYLVSCEKRSYDIEAC